MAIAPEQAGIGIRRHFTSHGAHPYDSVEWDRRDARITNYRDGTVAFEQTGVEFPTTWSLNATNIVAQKYFRGHLGTPDREWSLKQVIDRVVDTITGWGAKDGYFSDAEEAQAFSDELKYLLVHQRAAFNSPVWFNIGVPGERQQSTRLLHPRGRRHDGLDPQLVPGGGDHLQGRLRRRRQPVPHPLVGRAAQGRRHRIGSGQLHAGRRRVGRHDQVGRQDPPRREDGHPQRRPPRRRGLHLVQGGRGAQGAGARATPASTWTSTARDSHSIQYQNANNSVRVTDEFMQAVVDDADWHLRAVTTGETVKTVRARDLMRQIARPRGSAPIPACSSTPRSTAGTPRPTPVASTAATRAASTCTSTTRRATWPASTC